MSALAYYMATSAPHIPAAVTNQDEKSTNTPIEASGAINSNVPTAISNNNPNATKINDLTTVVSSEATITKEPKTTAMYYCAHRKHGYNNSHETKDCHKLKVIEQQNMAMRNIMFSVAKQHVQKAEKSRKIKQRGNDWASYNNLELKMEVVELQQKLEDAKKEMKKRGIR